MGCAAGKENVSDEREATGDFPGAAEAAKTLNRRRWLTQFGDKIAPHKFAHVCMVGAHDAAAYNMIGSRPCGVAPDAEDVIKNLIDTAGGPAYKVVSDWARTQDRPIFGLLNLGVRYFDIRLSIQEENPNELWVSHALFSIPFARVVEDIVAFYKNGDYQYFATSDDDKPGVVEFTAEELEANKELFILDVQKVKGHDGEQGAAINKAFNEAIMPLAQIMLKPGVDIANSTIGELWQKNVRVMTVYPNAEAPADSEGRFVPRFTRLIDSEWFNAQSLDEIKPKLEEGLKRQQGIAEENECPPVMVLQSVLTSDVETILKALALPDFAAPDSIEMMAGKLNDDAMEIWVNHLLEKDEAGKPKVGAIPVKDGRNVLMIDFCGNGKYEGLDAVEICHWLNTRKFGAVAELATAPKPELDLTDANQSLGLRVRITTEDGAHTWEAEWGGKESALQMPVAEALENTAVTEWSLIPVGDADHKGESRKVVIIRSGIGTFVHCADDLPAVTVCPAHRASDDDKFVLVPAGADRPGVVQLRRLATADVFVAMVDGHGEGLLAEGEEADPRTFFKVTIV